MVSDELLAYYDNNGDNFINPEDDIDEEHWTDFLMYCDENMDGSIEACELHACIVNIENVWRDENCPEFGDAYCECPYIDYECADAWTCPMVESLTNEIMNNMDTNGDA